MRVERTRQAERRTVTRRSKFQPVVDDDDAGSHALVVLAPAEIPAMPPTSYREAEFLAHLIATKDQLPQTRQRRRAEPSEAIAAYSAANSLTEHD
jgi:hypothetical protein